VTPPTTLHLATLGVESSWELRLTTGCLPNPVSPTIQIQDCTKRRFLHRVYYRLYHDKQMFATTSWIRLL